MDPLTEMHHQFYWLLAIALICVSCSRTDNKPLAIKATQSPTDGDSREPELTATQNGTVILSWVERLSEKRYALRAAVLEPNGWSETRPVAAGDIWFDIWADFTSVFALYYVTIATYWLSISGSGS